MKFSHLPLAGVVLGGLLAQVAPATAQDAADYAAGEILVKTAPASRSAVQKFQAQSGASVVHEFPAIGWSRIKLPSGTSVATAIAQYKKLAGVVSVEPNYRYQITKTPNDAFYKQLYGLQKIGAPGAWDVTTGKSDVVVAVLDTGINYNHADLAANMWHNPREIAGNGKDDDGNGIIDDVYGYDSYNNDGNPMDDEGHGTHCAGIIGAVGNNSRGVVGVNWKVQLMALKHAGSSGFSFTSDSVEAVQYAIDMKKRGVNLRVISNSYGGRGDSQALNDILNEAAQNGIISIVAAGNDGTDNDLRPTYPANAEVTGLVSVAASDDADQPASFTSYGQKTVDLAAPGVGILSTYIGKSNDVYVKESGTSMACPAVAGAAALLLSQVPGLDPATVKNRLLQGVDVLPQWRYNTVSHGRLSLSKLFATGIYRIGGRVLDTNGKPLAGAQLYLGDSTTPATYVRRDGSYSIDGLKPGTYLVTVKLPDWKFNPTPARVKVVAGAGYGVRQDFTGSTTSDVYTITGSVYVQSGTSKTPIEGAQIFLNTKTEPIAVTNARGQYTIINRTAGTYYLSAQYGGYDIKSVDRNNAVAVVKLPYGVGQKTVTDFVAKRSDNSAPNVVIRTPAYGGIYGPTELTKATGTATDVGVVDQMQFELYRTSDEGTSYYIWESKTWSDPGTFPGSSKIFLVQDYDSPSVTWSVDMPTKFELGNYTFVAYAFDSSSNFLARFASFSIQEKNSQNGYPTVTITNPTAGQEVSPFTSITAKGSASDEQGIDKIYVYLRRFDERGQIIGYYDWVNKTWVETNASPNTYKTFNANQSLTYSWSTLLPKMDPGNYEVGAFGRDIYGNEPPTDGTADTTRPFIVVEGSTPAVKAPTSAGNS